MAANEQVFALLMETSTTYRGVNTSTCQVILDGEEKLIAPHFFLTNIEELPARPTSDLSVYPVPVPVEKSVKYRCVFWPRKTKKM